MGAISLLDGRKGNAVVVGPRDNPKGATLVIQKGGAEEPERRSFSDSTALLSPELVTDVLCLQERAFGDSGLEAPEVPSEQ